MSKKLTIDLLEKERIRLLGIIQEHELKLKEVDDTLAELVGTSHLDKVYDDESPDSIKGTEDGI
jgi:hypothetical protein